MNMSRVDRGWTMVRPGSCGWWYKKVSGRSKLVRICQNLQYEWNGFIGWWIYLTRQFWLHYYWKSLYKYRPGISQKGLVNVCNMMGTYLEIWINKKIEMIPTWAKPAVGGACLAQLQALPERSGCIGAHQVRIFEQRACKGQINWGDQLQYKVSNLRISGIVVVWCSLNMFERHQDTMS